MQSNITIVVASCDNNFDLFEPFHYCMEKYWPDHPKIVYSTESINNPFYKTEPHNYKLQDWAYRIRDVVENIETAFILFMVDDIFIQKPVDTQLIESLTSLFSNKTAAINFEFKFDKNDTLKNNLVSIRSLNGRYKTSMMCQLWCKDKLIEVLSQGGDPWQVEQYNNHLNYEYLISNEGDFIFWGKKKGADWKNWGLFHGRWSKQAKNFFDSENYIIDYSKRGFYEENK